MNKRLSFSSIFANYSLPILLVIVFAFFSLLLPSSFPTLFNVKSILSNQSVIIMLSFAALTTIAAGSYNLSIGYQVGLVHILVIGLQVRSGMNWVLAALLVIGIGVLVGMINGYFVAVVGVSDFITTLAVGQILYGLGFAYTNGRQVVGDLPASFLALSSKIGGFPVAFIFVLVVGVIMHIILEYTPLGRYLYFVGANKNAASLSGISAPKYTMVAFVISGVITSIAGIVLGSLMRIGQTSVGPDYMMSAMSGALLGVVSFKSGRVNIPGALFGILLIAVVVSGLQQMGAAYWVEPTFNGAMLLIAVSLSIITSKRRATAIKTERNKLLRDSRGSGIKE